MAEENEFGDFEEVSEEGAEAEVEQQPGMPPARVKMPRQGEFIGVVVQRLGGNRMEVLSTDGKTRNCRVPGRFKRTMWLRPKDIVMIKPWVDDDAKADILYKYNSSSINQLRKKGILDKIKVEF
mgnify:CR=1 FL=1